MKKISNTQRVKSFIQETLGCSCPEKIFEDIRVGEASQSELVSFSVKKIVVGSRLLVYLIVDSAETPPESILHTLVLSGKSERDVNGYNRFRLVVFSANPGNDTVRLQLMFSRLNDIDDRIHLHVIDRLQYEGLLE